MYKIVLFTCQPVNNKKQVFRNINNNINKYQY